ncbi:MAG: hypothetical protein IKE43_04925 [Coriobacteriales bacterium]|nr:hypothetical protein [Coriobacteriales bacterium]
MNNFVDVPAAIVKKYPDAIALTVVGDCQSPGITENDVLICSRMTEVVPGSYVLIENETKSRDQWPTILWRVVEITKIQGDVFVRVENNYKRDVFLRSKIQFIAVDIINIAV